MTGRDSPGDMKEESSVIKAIGSLDQDALSSIFDEYAPAIFKYLLRLGVGSQEADQITGDVFVRLLEKISEGKGPRKNLRAYLFQIAYHLVVDESRERLRFTELEVADTVKQDSKPVQALAEDRLLLDRLAKIMERELTEEQRNVIVLRFQEDFSLKETAEIMGKNENAIKALQNRGINKIREAMSHEDGGE
jgi:RNA polymerase sigma-70 factor (ECF subfamily)